MVSTKSFGSSTLYVVIKTSIWLTFQDQIRDEASVSMLRAISVLVTVLAITGCSLLESPAQKQAREAQERAEEWARVQAEYRAMQRQSGSRCLSYGFYLNTPQFAMCMQTEMNNIRTQKIAQENLDLQKAADRRARWQAFSEAMDRYNSTVNSKPSIEHSPLNPRSSFNCTSVQTGSFTSMNCR